MRCTKVLIAFAFVAITANVAHGAPIDMPLQNVQGLIPSLTNLNSLQGLSPQTLSSLSSDGKNSPLNMEDLNSKLFSSTQSLPLQSLPVGGNSGDKTSGLNVNKINQLLSSGALSGTQSSTDNNVQRRDDTTDQSGLTSNTDSLTDSINKILSSVNPANLGGQSEKLTETNMPQSRSFLPRSEPKIGGDEPNLGKKPKTVLPRDETNSPLTSSPMNGLSQVQIQQITSQIMDSITKSMPMGYMGGMTSPTSTSSTTSTTNNLAPNMRRDDTTNQNNVMPSTDSLRDSITKILSSVSPSNLGGQSEKSTGTNMQQSESFLRRTVTHDNSRLKHPDKRSLLRGRDTVGTRITTGRHIPGKRSLLRGRDRYGAYIGGGGKVHHGKRSFLRRADGDGTIIRGNHRPHPGKRSEEFLPRGETSAPANSLSQIQIQQITSQIMDSITKSMPMGNMGDMNSPAPAPASTTTTSNLMPNMRRDDAIGQSALMPNTDSLKDSITKILSSMNLSNVGNKSGESSSMPSQNNVSPQKRSMDSEEDLYKRLSMDWFSTKPKEATVKKDRRDENMPNGLTNLQNEQITNQIMNQIKQVMGGMNMQNTNQDSSSTGSSTESSNNLLPNRRSTDETNLPSDQLQKTVLNIVSAVNLAQKSKQTTTQKRDGQTGSISNFNGLITQVTDVKSLPDNRLLIFGLLNGENDAPSPVSTTSDADKPSKRGHPSPAGSVGYFPQIIDIKMVSNNVVAILAKTQSSS